jgi:hypothetical protein
MAVRKGQTLAIVDSNAGRKLLTSRGDIKGIQGRGNALNVETVSMLS